MQKTLEMEKKRTEKLKGDVAKSEEDLANLKKVSLTFYVHITFVLLQMFVLLLSFSNTLEISYHP